MAIYGKKVESPVYRVSLSVPEHYLTQEKREKISVERAAFEKVKELEREYFGENAQLE